MNLATLQALLTVALNEAQEPWTGTIPTLINEALNQIQLKRSFNCMKASLDFTLNVTGDGPYTYALPSTFKELQSGPWPLRNTSTPVFLGSLWRIYTRQQVDLMNLTGIGMADRVAFLEQSSAGVWSLYFAGPLTLGIFPPSTTFQVDTYSMLPAVALPTDENDLMRKYPMLVLEWAKSLVFSLGSDEASVGSKREAIQMIYGFPGFTGYFNQASTDDASRATRGRTSRMGGA